mmetsp:Transcript_70037/g.130929  ORF Transcript_70037/g.130929 Transcript_70037/m.130929 type:complete len:221 (+) Transcript_70037:55-717(+)
MGHSDLSSQQVLARVAEGGLSLESVDEELKNDRHIVLAAVSYNGLALEHASAQLKSDHEIVLKAVAGHGSALEYATDELKSNREIVLTAVGKHGDALQYASDELKGDREIVLTAVARVGWALQFAADALLQDTSFAVAGRYRLYFFEITAMSGRSCTVAWMSLKGRAELLDQSCEKMGLQRRGTEKLLHGAVFVPSGVLDSCFSPGHPQRGKVVQYQLVR